MNTGFLKLPRIFIDSAVITAITLRAFMVYLTIRRFEYRKGYPPPALAKKVKRGFLVARVNQKKIASIIGMSRSSVQRAIALLNAVGWIKEVRLQNNGRGYVLGYDTEPNEHGRSYEVFFADAWLTRITSDLPEECRGWRIEAAEKRAEYLAHALNRVVDGLDTALGRSPLPRRDATKSAAASPSGHGTAPRWRKRMRRRDAR